MKETIKEGILTLIRNTEKEVMLMEEQKETATKYEDYSRALICKTAIFHKTKFIEQLKELL